MLDQIGGYPFAVQIYGREPWRQSQGASTISLDAVRSALPAAPRRLDRTVHRDHWAQASRAERDTSSPSPSPSPSPTSPATEHRSPAATSPSASASP